MSYAFQYYGAKSEKDMFVADYKLDVVKPSSSRIVWLHKDE